MTIRLEHTDHDELLRRFDDAAGRLAEERDRAAHEVDSLLAAGWSGGAADAFQAAWLDWLAAACDVLTALQAMTTALATTRVDLVQTDDEVAASATGLLGRIG